MNNWSKLKIGNLELDVPIIQGGMGVKISGKNLASAVANEGGVGVIASVGLGLKIGEDGLLYHSGDYSQANANALKEEIRAAREMSRGVIGVNIMYALSDFPELVKTAVEENVDMIISGAGPARDLPDYLNGKDIKLLPIVSSLKAAKVMYKSWNRLGHAPDAFIVEGPLAGGHLGFKYEDLINNTAKSLEEITKEVVEFAGDIPVISAGGIYTGQDIKEALEWGAAGVQMATRFVTTKECDANNKFKWEYLNASKEDIILIKSPVGLPGRVVNDDYLKKLEKEGRIKFPCDYQCLKTCNPKESPDCIADALVRAQAGDLDGGFAFAGANAYRCTPETCLDENGEFISVKTLMQRLSHEFYLPISR